MKGKKMKKIKEEKEKHTIKKMVTLTESEMKKIKEKMKAENEFNFSAWCRKRLLMNATG